MKRLLFAQLVLSLCFFSVRATTLPETSLVLRPKPVPATENCTVGCGSMFGCRVCMGGGGNPFCYVVDCGSCLMGACETGRGEIEGMQEPTPQAKQEPNSITKNLAPIDSDPIDVDAIREIGKVHPRFAVTLTHLNISGWLRQGKYEIHWTPVLLTPESVDAFIDRSAHREFFEKYDRDVRKLNKRIEEGRLKSIIYEIRIRLDADTGNRTITLSLPEAATRDAADPPYSSLELFTLKRAAVAATTVATLNEKPLTFWQIK